MEADSDPLRKNDSDPSPWNRELLHGDERQFEKSVAIVLISALLKSRLKPTKRETRDSPERFVSLLWAWQ
jgi:hypothetical protein